MRSLFRRQIAIPQDHGSWVFIIAPLLVGAFAARMLRAPTLILIVGAFSAFLLRQPLTMIVKVLAGRRPRTDLRAAIFWAVVYSFVGLLALVALILLGDGYVTYLAAFGVPVFAWHLWLVSRRAERRQTWVEVIATGVLSLAAPGAYWVSLGRYDPFGWWLWLLCWLQSAASILYAYLRLEQRVLPAVPDRPTQWAMARPALAFTSLNVLLTLLLGLAGFLPKLVSLPYLAQWLESLWGASHPAIKVKPVLIGVRLTIVSAIWTVLFVLVFRR